MARIKLDGLSYFPLDTSFFDSRKIKVLRSKFGCEGICLYIYLLAEIYRDRGYYLSVDEDFYAIVADDNGLDEDRVRQIVAYFCRNDFFNPTLFDKNILTSSEIQKQYQECVKVRGQKRLIEVRSDVWLLSECDSKDYICNELQNKSEIYPTKKSKENKSKVNKSKEKYSYLKGKTGDKTFDAESFAKWEFENTYGAK
ncbi:MAG: DUF4373 domain-containing protein [Clostridia bacterium]|nr:DUF4373 domain-containing protein [Clostridia bacterium]